MAFLADNMRNMNFISGDSREGSMNTLFSKFSWRISDPGSDVSVSWQFLGMELGTWSYSRSMLQKDSKTDKN